ncbi:J domain-containing protein [Acaryochloris sp. IP29b_bin.137]|uniref:J domain-containing protein n=1 Tax=Acaryochloris sp. IP29b_bin.137 TaxID=2969217 RepID=UPI002615FF92|nr:J domain-containing protein [Acaryochloris sp. IP29b_bin.137]
MSTNRNFYDLLDIPLQASSDEIHDAYRQKSKLYHPDTTALPQDVAIHRFQLLNEAYDTLSCPDLRKKYDSQIGLSTIRSLPRRYTQHSNSPLTPSRIEIQERPLSPGELFAVLILVITFLACLGLALILGVTRGEMILHAASPAAGIQPARYSALQSLAINRCEWGTQNQYGALALGCISYRTN